MGKPAVLIGDEMGLGKTIQAVGIINSDPTVKSVLIIAPKSLLINWARELSKWLVRPMTIGSVESNSDITLINYEMVNKSRALIDARSWDIVIADEAHYLKNPKAQRTRAVLGHWSRESGEVAGIRAKRYVALTGTPIVNRPIELWPLLNRWLDPQGIGRSFKAYSTRYCNAHYNGWGWDYSGAANLSELQTKLRLTSMVRRLKSEVLTELPPKRRQVIDLPLNGAASAVAREQQWWAEREDRLAEAEAAVTLAEASDDKDAYARAVANLRSVRGVLFTEMSQVRHDTAVAKLPAVLEHLHTVIDDSDDKVVVMAHHHDVIDAIAAEFGNAAVVLTGQTVDRQTPVDRFQNDPSVRLFVGSIRAAGVGITLTASSHVVFAELDWTPGNVSQAEDRCHRIGQVNSVLVQHLVLDGSLDANMARTIVAKQDVIDRALDRAVEDPAAAYAQAEEKATAEEKAEAAVEQVPAEEKAAIIAKLGWLTARCDGARSIDGAGFSKFDAPVGKSLAAQSSLSNKQALLGRKLVNKYRRQLQHF
jgi:SWI/SNF-related matrix-associated actin-dependent regulator 1 of chromatin subfamily A